MTHFFDRKDRWGNGMAVWVLAAMVFIAPLASWAIIQTQMENDVEKWLPEDDPELKILRWTHKHFTAEERIFLTWDTSSLNDPRTQVLVDGLIGHVDAEGIRRGGHPHIARIVQPRDLLLVMQKNGVEPQEAMRRLEGLILGAGSMKLTLTEYGRTGIKRTIQDLTEAAKQKLGMDLRFSDPVPDFWSQVAIPAPPPDEGETQSPPAAPAVMNAAGKPMATESVEHDLQVSWDGIRLGTEKTIAVADWLVQYAPNDDASLRLVDKCFFALGAPATIALSISEAGLSDKEETVSIIKQSAVESGIPLESLRLGGSTISAVELNHEVKKTIWDTSFPWIQFHRRSVMVTSSIVSALLAYLLLRSIRLATMVLFVALYATLVSTALVPATGGSMNMVLVVMPTLLMVLTLSGAIHVANYWKHAACKDEATSVHEAVRMSWMPCLLASLTTAIGLISLCTSPLSPVRDFGIYAAAGTMLSLCVILVSMPSLLLIWPGRAPAANELEHPGWRMLGRGLTKFPVVQSLVVLAICGVCSYGLKYFRIETKVIRYFPEHAKIYQDYEFIEKHLAGIMPVETIVRFDAQSQKDTTFLERMEVVRQIQEQLRANPEITGSLSLADFLPVSEPLEENAGSLVRIKYNKRATIIQDRIRGGEIPAAKTLYAIADKAQDLSRVGDHGLNQADDELWRITSQVAIMNDNDFGTILSDVNRITQNVLKLHPGSMHTVTGSVPLFLRTQEAVLYSLVSSFGLAFVLILGVFAFTLRSFWAGLVAMIPNIVPITVVFGTIAWLGNKVDVGTMITASIALGIAVDGTLHYLTWVQEGMRAGKTRRESIIDALVHCGPAMWQTSAAVALGLLVMVPAELLLISRFGWLMAAMIGVALIGDIILMPQVLAGPLGYLFEPPKQKGSGDGPSATEEVPVSTKLPAPHFSTRSTSDQPRPAS